MAIARVNPNRMELLRLKNRLTTARRGHRLMKEKRDELMRQFLSLVQETASLRRQVEELLRLAYGEMVLARAAMQTQVVAAALLTGKGNLEVGVGQESTMSVRSPVFTPVLSTTAPPAGAGTSGDDTKPISYLPYGMTSVTGELDQAVDALNAALPFMLQLAQREKKVQLLADEITSTRRRVNSLEYILIPELETSIRDITGKMEENERGNLTRLMKVKDMIIEAKLAGKAAPSL